MSAVLAVVLMVLKIIGMILLALLLLLLLALLLPAGIHFRWSHIGGLRLQLCYGPLHFTLYPRKADEEEKKAEPKAETKQGNTPKTEPTSAAPPKPTPPPAKAELPAQPTMEKQTEPTEAKPAKAPEEPQKAEPAPPAEKGTGKTKSTGNIPAVGTGSTKTKSQICPGQPTGSRCCPCPGSGNTCRGTTAGRRCRPCGPHQSGSQGGPCWLCAAPVQRAARQCGAAAARLPRQQAECDLDDNRGDRRRNGHPVRPDADHPQHHPGNRTGPH